MAELAGEPFVALPPHEGSVLGDRLLRLSLGAGFDPDIAQWAPVSWTAMALVGAEVGGSLTVSSVAENVTDTHVHFPRVLDETCRYACGWHSVKPQATPPSVRSLRWPNGCGPAGPKSQQPRRRRRVGNDVGQAVTTASLPGRFCCRR